MVGQTTDREYVRILEEQGFSRLWNDEPSSKNPRPIQVYDGELWGFDSGAYAYYTRGMEFDSGRYMRRLDAAQRVGVPYMNVLPDVVGKGPRSLRLSLEWLERQPEEWAGSHYLAVQDGITATEVEPHIEPFAGIFLGGTDSFKATASVWAGCARRHGKKFHYGRCSTPKRWRFAKTAGADSLDTSFVLWERARMQRLVEFFSRGDPQTTLNLGLLAEEIDDTTDGGEPGAMRSA